MPMFFYRAHWVDIIIFAAFPFLYTCKDENRCISQGNPVLSILRFATSYRKKDVRVFPKRLLRLSKKAAAFFDKKIAPCCSARNVRRMRTLRTFAGREVFLSTYTPPPKTDHAPFVPAGAKLYEVFDTLKRRSGFPQTSFSKISCTPGDASGISSSAPPAPPSASHDHCRCKWTG